MKLCFSLFFFLALASRTPNKMKIDEKELRFALNLAKELEALQKKKDASIVNADTDNSPFQSLNTDVVLTEETSSPTSEMSDPTSENSTWERPVDDVSEEALTAEPNTASISPALEKLRRKVRDGRENLRKLLMKLRRDAEITVTNIQKVLDKAEDTMSEMISETDENENWWIYVTKTFANKLAQIKAAAWKMGQRPGSEVGHK